MPSVLSGPDAEKQGGGYRGVPVGKMYDQPKPLGKNPECRRGRGHLQQARLRHLPSSRRSRARRMNWVDCRCITSRPSTRAIGLASFLNKPHDATSAGRACPISSSPRRSRAISKTICASKPRAKSPATSPRGHDARRKVVSRTTAVAIVSTLHRPTTHCPASIGGSVKIAASKGCLASQRHGKAPDFGLAIRTRSALTRIPENRRHVADARDAGGVLVAAGQVAALRFVPSPRRRDDALACGARRRGQGAGEFAEPDLGRREAQAGLDEEAVRRRDRSACPPLAQGAHARVSRSRRHARRRPVARAWLRHQRGRSPQARCEARRHRREADPAARRLQLQQLSRHRQDSRRSSRSRRPASTCSTPPSACATTITSAGCSPRIASMSRCACRSSPPTARRRNSATSSTATPASSSTRCGITSRNAPRPRGEWSEGEW